MSVIRPWGCGSYFAQCSVHPALALSFNFNSSIQLEPTCRCVLRVPPLLRACLCALCLALCVCFMRVRLCALCARVLLFECLFFLFCLFVCLLTCILVFVFVFFVWCSEYSHWCISQSATIKPALVVWIVNGEVFLAQYRRLLWQLTVQKCEHEAWSMLLFSKQQKKMAS